MKKIIALILAMTMVFAFAACGAKTPQQPSTGSDISTGDEPATMPEDNTDDQPATMPEDDQVADDMPEVPAEDSTDDQPATMPEDNTDDQPATMPEDNTDDQPATMPEDNTGSEQEGTVESQPVDEAVINELFGIIDMLNSGVELPMVGSMALDAEVFPYYAFIDKPAGVEAVVSEAMMGSIAHSVVIFKCADGVDVSAIASQVEANVNPRKWICVEAEKTAVVVKGNYILLVMSNTVAADAILANFNSL